MEEALKKINESLNDFSRISAKIMMAYNIAKNKEEKEKICDIMSSYNELWDKLVKTKEDILGELNLKQK